MIEKIEYIKLPKSFQQQVDLLESRGLYINNKLKAEKVLENISYNRLSAYWYPLLKEPKDDEIFKENSNFDTIFKIYQFDSELRILVFYAIEQIEIAVRTQIIFHLSHKYNSGFWFENKEAFKSYPFYIHLLKTLSDNVRNSNHEYIKKYNRKYIQYLPPSWKSFETLSFNTLFSIFKNLNDKNEQILIAKHFGIHHEVFKSWIDSIIYVRNICAHHSRLWNIKLTISPTWPKKTHNKWIQSWDNLNQNSKDKELKLYPIISITKYLLDTVNPYHKFDVKLRRLIEQYPDIDIAHMGFTENWEKQDLWL